MIMILTGNDRKKARGALIVMLMLVSSALVLVNASSASAALPWGRPGAPEWEEPEEVRPYVRGPDEIAPTIRLRLAFEKGDAPGDWDERAPVVESEDGKTLYIYQLSWADYGDKPGKLQIHALVSDGIIELSDGLAKDSPRVTIRGEKYRMGEYASTAANPVEGTFVFYHKLHGGYKFRLYVTVEDNAGNQADTRDIILYQIEVQSRPVFREPDEPTKDDLIDTSKPEPKGLTYDPRPPEVAKKYEAYWFDYTYRSAGYRSTYPVSVHDTDSWNTNVNKNNAAMVAWDFNEQDDRYYRVYYYYNQAGELKQVWSISEFSGMSGRPTDSCKPVEE